MIPSQDGCCNAVRLVSVAKCSFIQPPGWHNVLSNTEAQQNSEQASARKERPTFIRSAVTQSLISGKEDRGLLRSAREGIVMQPETVVKRSTRHIDIPDDEAVGKAVRLVCEKYSFVRDWG